MKGDKQKIKRIILLGNSGFIGSHLEKFFKGQFPQIELVGKSIPSIDLTKKSDVDKLSKIFDMNTALVMCAAIKRDYGDNIETFKKNLEMITNLCQALGERAVKRFVFFSSTAVYGEDVHNTSISEETPVCPKSYYGLAKFASECLLIKTFEKLHNGNSNIAIIRPPAIFGPGENIKNYGPSGFIKSVIKNKQIIIWGDGKEKREFIFIDDILRVVGWLTFSEYSGVLNIASGKSSTFREVIDYISQISGNRIKLNSRKRTKKKADHVFSNRLFSRLLPNFQFTSLKDGIKRTWDEEAKNR